MNQEQRNYAAGRVTFMADEKVKEITEKYTIPAVILPFKEKLALVRKGKVSVTTGRIDEYDHLRDIFDFSKFEKKETFNQSKIPVIASIKDQATQTRDKIMLAESTEALSAIKAFEKFIKAIS